MNQENKDGDLSCFAKEKGVLTAVSKIDELLLQGGRVFLIGAGASKCSGLPLTAELTDKVMASSRLSGDSTAILGAIRAHFAGATSSNIEDYLSELVDHLAIAKRRDERVNGKSSVKIGNGEYGVISLEAAVAEIKSAIYELINIPVDILTHRRFVKSLHRAFRPGKFAHGQVIDYLVLNYDSLIEDSLALERHAFSDGMEGGVTGWWNPDGFDREDISARVLKLHGSINWSELEASPLPVRLHKNIESTVKDGRNVLIWPASTKYRETQLDPYAQLAARARASIRPPSSTQRTLVICGYSFGDAHINFEIDRALRESLGELTVVIFTSENEPSGIIAKWREDAVISRKILVYANRGYFHGENVVKVDYDLPWWRFEILTRLLEGER